MHNKRRWGNISILFIYVRESKFEWHKTVSIFMVEYEWIKNNNRRYRNMSLLNIWIKVWMKEEYKYYHRN